MSRKLTSQLVRRDPTHLDLSRRAHRGRGPAAQQLGQSHRIECFLIFGYFCQVEVTHSHVAHLGTPLVSKPNSPQVRVALCLMAPAGWTSGPMPEKSALRPWDRAESQLLAYTRRDAPFGAHSGPTALHRPLSSVAASSLQVPKQTWPSRAPTNVSIQPNMSSHAPCRLCRASQPPRAWTLARVTHG